MGLDGSAPGVAIAQQRFPHLDISYNRLSIDRLALAPPVLGESLVATVEGSARLAGETAHLALDLHRTDDAAGNILLAMEVAGATPILQLQLEASEPTGVLLDRVLGRTDRAPLALSLNGTGPLADWHGRLAASAGTLAQFNADLMLAVASQTIFGLTGTAALTPLLPPDFAPLIGNQLALSLHGSSGERMVLDALSIEIAVTRASPVPTDPRCTGVSGFEMSNSVTVPLPQSPTAASVP